MESGISTFQEGALEKAHKKKKNKVNQQAKSSTTKLEIHKPQGSRIFVEESCYECQMLNKEQYDKS